MFYETKKFKEMYKAELKFPEGWGYFLELHINNCCIYIFRYRLQFDRESKGEIEARKKAAQEPLKYVSEVC